MNKVSECLNMYKNKLNIYHAKKAVGIIFRTVVLIGLGFMILYPIIVKITTAFKSYEDLYDPTVVFIPKNFTLSNFRILWNTVDYPKLLISTIGITFLIAFLQTVSCTLVSYGFARFDFIGKKLFFAFAIITLIIPPQAILLPIYMKFRFFNPFQMFTFWGELTGISLIDTLWPQVLLSVGAVGFKNGLYIYLLRQHFTNMPKAIEEAAYVDGCNRFKTFWRVMLPGATSMITTVFLFSFVWTWNDYYYNSVLSPHLNVMANKLMGLSFSSMGSLAGSLLSSTSSAPKYLLHILPLVILYAFAQKFFTQSIEKSGIVG